MTSTKLNRDATGDYLEDLNARGYIKVVGEPKGRKFYSMTDKGKEWLRIYKSLLTLEASNYYAGSR